MPLSRSAACAFTGFSYSSKDITSPLNARIGSGCAQVTQLKAAALRLRGWSDERLSNELWTPQYHYAGEAMHSLCVDMRGFYLKAGQFLGARGDFVPAPMCEKLSQLHDRVSRLPTIHLGLARCRCL